MKTKLAPEVPEDWRASFFEPTVRVTPTSAPYMTSAEVFLEERTNRGAQVAVYHPQSWLIVRAPGRGLHMLATRAHWSWLRETEVLRLVPESRRTAYVRAYAHTVGRAEQRYEWIADRVEDLQLLTRSDPQSMPRAFDATEAAFARSVEAKYRSVIVPLALPGERQPFVGVFYANGRGRKLLKVDVVVAADGDVSLVDTVLESKVPMPTVYP